MNSSDQVLIEGNIHEISAQLGVDAEKLRALQTEFETKSENVIQEDLTAESDSIDSQELARLRKELQDAKLERDVCKKLVLSLTRPRK